jgi:hypothetical protein
MNRIVALLAAVLWSGVAIAAQAPDTPVVTGPNMQQVPIGSIYITIPGVSQSTLGGFLSSPTFPGPVKLDGTGTSGQYDAQISVTGGGSVPGAGTLIQRSGLSSFAGVDGTTVFQIPNVAAAVEFIQPVAGIAGDGAEIYCTNGLFTGSGVYPNTLANGNVDCVYAAQNLGNHWFGDGAGTILELANAGAPTTYYPIIKPGTATTYAVYGSNGNTSLDAPTGSNGYLTVNGIIMASFSNVKALSATSGYPNFFGSTGSAGVNCTNLTSSGSVSCLLQAQGTATVTLRNDSGNFVTFVNSGANDAVDGFRMQAASATAPLIITGLSGTSVGIGATSLAAGATQGFFMGPACTAIPTGVPVGAAGRAPQCYNTSTHKLNIYDTGAASWYSVTLTPGAG